MTATATPIPASPLRDEQLDVFRMMHRSMREDAAALVTAIGLLGPEDRTAAAALGRWFEAFRAGIVHHHTVEDDVFWPVLAAGSPTFAATAPGLEDDHHHLDEAMQQVATSLAAIALLGRDHRSDRMRAIEAAEALVHVLEDHLDREEATAIPAMVEVLSAERYDELHEEATKDGGFGMLRWILPWLLDHASAEEAAKGLAELPAPVRWVNALRWSRRYARLAEPIRAARTVGSRRDREGDRRSPRPRVAGIAAMVVLLAALVSGCGDDGTGGQAADGATASTAPSPAAEPASDITITATDYDFGVSSGRIAAGRVRMTLDNQGDEAHQVQFGLVEPGTTAESFYEAYHHHGAESAEKLLRWQTGVNAVEPGEKATVVGDLEPGRYLMVCFVPGHDGESHIDKKMIVPVEVVPGGDPVDEPATDGEIVLKDYAIDLPKGFDGTGTFAVRNAGPANHEMILMRYKGDNTLADLAAWSDAGSKGEAPITYEGGLGTIPQGETSYVDLDLGPGRYIALCVITGPTGMIHALMGMTAEFELT